MKIWLQIYRKYFVTLIQKNMETVHTNKYWNRTKHDNLVQTFVEISFDYSLMLPFYTRFLIKIHKQIPVALM